MKKIKFVLKILILIGIFICILSLNKKEHGIDGVTSDSVGWIADVTDLNWYASKHDEEFIGKDYSLLLHKTFTAGNEDRITHMRIRQWLGDYYGWVKSSGGLMYNNGACLYHAQSSTSWGTSTYYEIVNLVDYDFDETRGKYVARVYGRNSSDVEQTGTPVSNENLAQLAAAIYYTDTQGAEPNLFLDGNIEYQTTEELTPEPTVLYADSVNRAAESPSRTVLHYYYQLAVNSGALSVDTKCTNNYSANYSYNYDSDIATQAKNDGTYMNNYSKIQNLSTNAKVKECTTTQTIIQNLKVSYGGIGVDSISIENKSELQFKISTDGGTTWKDVSEIPNNSEFELKVIGDLTNLAQIKITFNQKEFSYYKARFAILCRSISYDGDQNVAEYAAILNKYIGRADVTVQNDTKGKITVKKVEKTTREPLTDVKFKVEVVGSGWLRGTNGTYTYNETQANATTYTITNQNGYVLDKLELNKKYKIWEVEYNNANFDITKQDDYDESKRAVDLTKQLTEGYIELTNSKKEREETFGNKALEGTIVVNKTDSITKKELRVGLKIQTDEGADTWLIKNADGTNNYKGQFNNATVFYTTGGTATIENLGVHVSYKVWETSVANDNYELTKQSGYNSTLNAVNLTGDSFIDLKNYKNNTTNVYLYTTNEENTPSTGTLEVVKTDPNLNNKKLRMGFIVQTNIDGNLYWLKQDSNGTYDYKVTEQNNATVFYTDNGTKTLSDLALGIQYQVWETVSPSETYVLREQTGWNSTYNAVQIDGWKTLNKNAKVTANGINIGKISISGYVWLDKTDKGYDNYGLYKGKDGEPDILLSGMTVNLKKKGEEEAVASVVTDSEGKYTFKDAITYGEEDNYYVEFDYSDMTIEGKTGTKYIPVQYEVEYDNEYKPVNTTGNKSEAMMSSVPERDAELMGIATTYTGTKSDELNKYGLSRLLSDYEIKNVNLGLREIYDPDYTLNEDLKYVRIVLNNHEYIYEYGKKGLGALNGAPTVVTEYKREIYPSAIYNLKYVDGEGDIESENTLKVYVIYQTLIKNSTTENNPLKYVEDKLHITSFTNSFDTSKYEYSTASSQSEKITEISGDFTKWNVNSDTATYTGDTIELGPNEYALKYIQFKLKKQRILDILKNEISEDEHKITVEAHTKGYHTFYRDDYSWYNMINRRQRHISVEKTKDDTAPYVIFKLGEERIVKGTVFEDRIITTNGEKLGNGQKDDGENAVKNMKVQLISAQNGMPAILYVEKDNERGYDVIEASQITNDEGEYSFTGVMPGDYYVRYIYDDGTQETVIKDGTEEGKVVNKKDYKSTIITSNVTKNALGYSTNVYENEWYKYLEGNNYSIAIDDLAVRSNLNDGAEIDSMIANSAKIDITIENTKENIMDGEMGFVNNFEGFNFGIVIQPKQAVEITKKIINVSLYNEPHMIFYGNPETDNMPGVVDLDGANDGGSSYVRMEVEEGSIYGSQITLRYYINLKNVSDITYYEKDAEHYGWYYKFGEHNDSYSGIAELNIEELMDCYDPSLEYKEIAQDGFTIEKIKRAANEWENDYRQKSATIQLEVANNGEAKYSLYKEALAVTGWGTLARNESKNVSFEMTKLLSTKDDDLNFINVAAVDKAKVGAEGEEENENIEKSLKLIATNIEDNVAKAEATVSAPTGGNNEIMKIIYSIVGIGVLSIMLIGIIVIKRIKK